MADGGGGIVSEGTVISEPAAIAAFVEAKAGNVKRIGLETGPTTTWFRHELRGARLAGDLHRCPPRQGGAVVADQQERPQ
ncbi:MAG: hypothetical protein IIA68_02700 [Proteobacteria bacterium]|nr:hypothetical protein [Pseudomonadota bacterium]